MHAVLAEGNSRQGPAFSLRTEWRLAHRVISPDVRTSTNVSSLPDVNLRTLWHHRSFSLVGVALLAACSPDQPTDVHRSSSLSPQTSISVAQVGPLDVSGDIEGAAYRIVVPAVWNGTLLVYAHGYRDKADHPGEVDNVNADVVPNAALANVLLAQGYALAGSAFRDNGWAVDEGIQDMAALVSHFRETVAKPSQTIMWGFSMGSVIALKSMERFGGLYDGAIAACAAGAGASSTWDAVADLSLAYQTVFGIPDSWGTFDDVRDDLDFETEVQPKLIAEVGDPANFPRFEFMRLVTGTPGRGITTPPPPAFYPGWVFTDFFFGFEARAELERRAGGPIVQNRDREYSLAASEIAYLQSLGIPEPVITAWLASMNGQRTADAPPNARAYLRNNADYSGNIKHPVLTLHTVIDPLLPVSQQNAYAQTVIAAGRSDRLVQAFTNGNGHCAFTGPQLISAVNTINAWVTTGTAPTASAFPAALGFVPNFAPPAMLQP